MDVLEMLVLGYICLACFMMGAKLGQKVTRGEEIEVPNPVKAYKEHEERKEAQKEQSRIDTIMQNIEKYDGTGRGQEDVPGR